MAETKFVRIIGVVSRRSWEEYKRCEITMQDMLEGYYKMEDVPVEAGIEIEYVKNRKAFYISGWYDTCGGIGGTEIPLGEFCKRLGIRRNDLPDERDDTDGDG